MHFDRIIGRSTTAAFLCCCCCCCCALLMDMFNYFSRFVPHPSLFPFARDGMIRKRSYVSCFEKDTVLLFFFLVKLFFE